VTAADPYLLVCFRDFYREVVRLRREVEHAAPPPPAAGAAAPPAPGASPAPGTPQTPQTPLVTERPSPVTAVRERLLATLERQAAGAARIGGLYGAETFQAAQYVMAALADEVFLQLDWPGRDAWQANLLESRLFGTHRAGEEVFLRLDALLQSRDPIYTDLAKVYLFALALGFQGRYRDTAGGPVRLDDYRRQLFDVVVHREPLLAAGAEPLFSEAYTRTLAEAEEVRLPYLRRWVVAACAVGGVWLVVQWRLWAELTEDLWPLVLQILGAA
jgi:type VI secretion system protein ImpK